MRRTVYLLLVLVAFASGCAEKARMVKAFVRVEDAETGDVLEGALVGIRPVAKSLTRADGCARLFWSYKPTFVESAGYFLARPEMSTVRYLAVAKQGYATAIEPLGGLGERLPDFITAVVKLRRLKGREGEYDAAYDYYTALFQGAEDSERRAFARNMMEVITHLRAFGTVRLPLACVVEGGIRDQARSQEFSRQHGIYDGDPTGRLGLDRMPAFPKRKK